MLLDTMTKIETPPVFYEDEQKAEIRSINKLIPEYNTQYVNCYTSLLQLYNKKNKNIKLYSINIDEFNLGVSMSKYYKNKNIIKILKHLYKCEKPFIYSIKKCENGVIAENEYLNIYGYGENAAEAEQELFKYVNDLWENYVEEDDKNLDKSAIVLKEKIKDSMRKIY